MPNDDNDAAMFARSWIRANINPGPHSMNDGPVVPHIVEHFVTAAADAGLSQDQLEQALGDVTAFLQNAYDDAHRAWKPQLRR